MGFNKGIIYAVLSSLTFSVMNVLVKYISSEIPSHEIAFFRGFIGMLLILLLMHVQHIKFSKEDKPLLLLRGVLGGMYIVVYFFTISNMKLADASILVHLSGFFVLIFSSWLLNEKLHPKAFIFVITIIIGAGFIINPLAYTSYSVYAVFGVLSALLSALASITIRKLAKSGKHHRYEIIFYFLASATVVSFVLMYRVFVMPNVYQFTLLILLAVVSLLAQVFLTGAFTNANAIIVEVVRYIGIFFNAGWGYLIFKEKMSIMTVFGGTIIIISSIFLSRQKNIA